MQLQTIARLQRNWFFRPHLPGVDPESSGAQELRAPVHGVEQIVVAGVDVGIDEHDRQASVLAGAGHDDVLLRERALQRLVGQRGGIVLEQPEVAAQVTCVLLTNTALEGMIGRLTFDLRNAVYDTLKGFSM